MRHVKKRSSDSLIHCPAKHACIEHAAPPTECTDVDGAEISSGEENRLEAELRKTSRKHNLSKRNVRNILKEVITHETVVDMMKAAIRDTQDLPLFEPKMTRSRLKQAVEQGQKVNWSLPAVSSSHKGSGIIDLELEEEEDSSDEEYCPDEEEEEDTTDELFLSDGDSLASPLRILPSPVSSTQSSATPPSGHTAECSVGCVNPVPDTLADSFLDRLNAVEEELNSSNPAYFYQDESLACRTRSKLPLVDVPITRLEAELLAPDFTADMYASPTQQTRDPHWTQWLKGLLAPDNTEEAEDEDDPEYNVLEELDEPDMEDYRTDRAVQITKKEVNELLEEFFETLQEQIGEEEEHEEQEEDDAVSPEPEFKIPQSIRSVMKQNQTRRALQDTTNTTPPPNHCRNQTQQHVTQSSNGHITQSSNGPVIQSSNGPVIQSSNVHPTQSSNGLITQELASKCSVTSSHLTMPSISHVTQTPISQVTQLIILPGKTQTLKLSESQKKHLQQQIQQHVQLLTQVHLLTKRVQALNNEAAITKNFLVELDQFSARAGASSVSSFRVCNLRPSLDLITEHSSPVCEAASAVNSAHHSKRWLPSMTPATNSHAYPLLPAQLAWIFASRPEFMYPELLPVCSLDPALHTGSRNIFTPGEDGLIVLGLKHFEGCRNRDQLITDFLVCKKRQTFTRHLKDMCSKRAQPNVIKAFLSSGKLPPLPLACSTVDPSQLCPPADRASNNCPNWLKNSREIIQKTRLASSSPHYPSSLPLGCTLRLHPYWLLKDRNTVKNPKRRLFTLAHNATLKPLASRRETDEQQTEMLLEQSPPHSTEGDFQILHHSRCVLMNMEGVCGPAAPITCQQGQPQTKTTDTNINTNMTIPTEISGNNCHGAVMISTVLDALADKQNEKNVIDWVKEAERTPPKHNFKCSSGGKRANEAPTERRGANKRLFANGSLAEDEVGHREPNDDQRESETSKELNEGPADQGGANRETAKMGGAKGVLVKEGGGNGRLAEDEGIRQIPAEEQRTNQKLRQHVEQGGANRGPAKEGGAKRVLVEEGGAKGASVKEGRLADNEIEGDSANTASNREPAEQGGANEAPGGGANGGPAEGEGSNGGAGEGGGDEREAPAEGGGEGGDGGGDEGGDEDEEEEEFDDLTQDEDEEEVMSSASEESVLSVPELQETMKQLTWLAAERRLGDADSEEDLSQEDEEEDEEDGAVKEEESKEEAGLDTRGDEETAAGEDSTRGTSRGPARGRGRSRPPRGLKRSRPDRMSKDASKLLLLYDVNILEKDPHRETKDMAYAQGYLSRVHEALQDNPLKLEQFVSLLGDFGKLGETPDVVALFRRLQCILGHHTDLLRDFAAFLRPEQALECGLFEEQQAFDRSRRFLRQLEISFGDNPSHYQKIIKALQMGPDMSPTSVSELKSQMTSLLKGHNHLQSELWVFFDDLHPPLAQPGQFEEAQWPEEGEERDGRESVGPGDSGGFEEVTLPELEEEEDRLKALTVRQQRRKIHYKSDWSEKSWVCLCHDANLRKHGKKPCPQCKGLRVSRAMKSLHPLYSHMSCDKEVHTEQSSACWEDKEEDDEEPEKRRLIEDVTSSPDPPPLPLSPPAPVYASSPPLSPQSSVSLPLSSASLPVFPPSDPEVEAAQSLTQELTVCAKNISLTASGEKVILWTRDADRVILTRCQQDGANPSTFQHISSVLGNKTPNQVCQRFQDLMRLFHTTARHTSPEEEVLLDEKQDSTKTP